VFFPVIEKFPFFHVQFRKDLPLYTLWNGTFFSSSVVQIVPPWILFCLSPPASGGTPFFPLQPSLRCSLLIHTCLFFFHVNPAGENAFLLTKIPFHHFVPATRFAITPFHQTDRSDQMSNSLCPAPPVNFDVFLPLVSVFCSFFIVAY